MKVCHAGALALVGWYLMEPPVIPSSDRYDVQAPLSRWKITARFDTAAQCHARRKQLIHKMAAPTLPSPEKLRKQGITVQDWIAGQLSGIDEFISMRCVATDDPRLKEH